MTHLIFNVLYGLTYTSEEKVVDISHLYDVERMARETGISAASIHEALLRSGSETIPTDKEALRLLMDLSFNPNETRLRQLHEAHKNRSDLEKLILRKWAMYFMKKPPEGG